MAARTVAAASSKEGREGRLQRESSFWTETSVTVGVTNFQRGSGNRQCFQLKFVQGDDAPPFLKNTSRIENLLQSKKAGECLASLFGFWMNCKMEGKGGEREKLNCTVFWWEEAKRRRERKWLLPLRNNTGRGGGDNDD